MSKFLGEWFDQDDWVFVMRCAVLLFFAVIALVIVAAAAGFAVLIFDVIRGGAG